MCAQEVLLCLALPPGAAIAVQKRNASVNGQACFGPEVLAESPKRCVRIRWHMYMYMSGHSRTLSGPMSENVHLWGCFCLHACGKPLMRKHSQTQHLPTLSQHIIPLMSSIMTSSLFPGTCKRRHARSCRKYRASCQPRTLSSQSLPAHAFAAPAHSNHLVL